MQISHQSSLLTEFNKQLSSAGSNAVGTDSSSGVDFGNLLFDGIKSVNDKQAASQRDIEGMLSGEDIDTAEVISSIQKADMAFQLLLQVRNKLMKAYEEIQAINV